jgi:hypothetical protein
MKTCMTCAYWNANGISAFSNYGEEEGDEDVESMHRRCLRILHGNSGSVPFDTIEHAPALVTDGSGYAASLYTLPTFVCALWEEFSSTGGAGPAPPSGGAGLAPPSGGAGLVPPKAG